MNKYIIYELEQLEKITGYSLQHIKNDINDVYSILEERAKEIERLHNIIEKARAKSILLQNKYGYILDDLTFSLSTGSDNNVKKN